MACGDVISESTLERYLHARLATTGVTDAAFAAAASVAANDRAVLDVELRARIVSPRLREVGERMGRQLLRAGRQTFPDPALDALLLAQQGQADAALATCRGVLNAGRAFGDEAVQRTLHVRLGIQTLALQRIERCLAQGEPSERVLAAV